MDLAESHFGSPYYCNEKESNLVHYSIQGVRSFKPNAQRKEDIRESLIPLFGEALQIVKRREADELV